MKPGDCVCAASRWRRRAIKDTFVGHTVWPLTWLLGALILAGCAAVANAPPTAADQQRWQGRFALTLIAPSSSDSEADGTERAQGRFRLEKQAQNLTLALFSPFGQQLAQARSDSNGAVLVTSKGQRFRANDPDSLIEQALGWRLPVSVLPDWLAGKGLPANDSWVEREQWMVRVERRTEAGKPSRLAARWPAGSNTDTRRLNLFIIVDPGAQP